ncbi:hypothetical protein TPPAVE_067 [Candidatus Tremblaya phenacola PAVE]|nr:hypothetical protein TPPAVE_067 [Candidatus Tremblaya phenacola PAVE]
MPLSETPSRPETETGQLIGPLVQVVSNQNSRGIEKAKRIVCPPLQLVCLRRWGCAGLSWGVGVTSNSDLRFYHFFVLEAGKKALAFSRKTGFMFSQTTNPNKREKGPSGLCHCGASFSYLPGFENGLLNVPRDFVMVPQLFKKRKRKLVPF